MTILDPSCQVDLPTQQISDDQHSSARTPTSKPYVAKVRRKFELKLVYRILRLISDWALSGFFSEVYVEGQENVPEEGALILTPCHHNELIDIATLSATIPHRRIIAYWTKASLFKNPVSRFILSSAGSIPVARIPRAQASQAQRQSTDGNGTPGDASENSTREQDSTSHQALFDATYKELAKRGGGVLGIFPEGTSYTLPRIVQVKEGAARAAVGYIRWTRSRLSDSRADGRADIGVPISVVPVGIVYTDKSRYRSRLYVRYGKPIELRSFVGNKHVPEDVDDSIYQSAVPNLTEEIKRQMARLTFNTPDWDLLYAVQTARAILWEDERSLPLHEFVDVSQRLINAIERPLASKILLRYHALLYHTDLTHASLAYVPFPPPDWHSSARGSPRREVLSRTSIVKLMASLPFRIVPLLFSLPTHLAHLPAYIFGSLASRAFAREEEARAQYKVIFGGLGRAVGTLGTSFALMRSTAGRTFLRTAVQTTVDYAGSAVGLVGRVFSTIVPAHAPTFSSLGDEWEKFVPFVDTVTKFVERGCPKLGRFGDWIGILALAWTLCAWHADIIDSDYLRYRRIRATLSILRAVLSCRRADAVKPEVLEPYLSTPPPPTNPYIAKSLQCVPENIGSESAGDEGPSDEIKRKASRKLARSTLIRYLLLARAEAVYRTCSVARNEGDKRLCERADIVLSELK